MPKYFFQQKINTIAKIREPFEHNGFLFEAHKVDTVAGTQDGWIASKEITADNVDAAFQDFYSDFHPLFDKLSFVTQCFAVVKFEPYLIKRADRTEFFLLHSNELKHIPLHFGADELESLKALERYKQKGDAFRYLREAINASDFYARLAMLASALEAIAGEKNIGKTDSDYIKDKILKDDALHKKIFKHTTGIRNQLLHGKKIDGEEHGDVHYNDIIYDKIIGYFNSEHGTKINTNVIGAPRTLGRNYKFWHGWLKPRSDGSDVDLKRFCELDLCDVTKHFETIEKPRGY